MRETVLRNFAVSRETATRLDGYVAALRNWSEVKNLIGPATVDAVWTRHIADSLQLMAFRRPTDRRWLDLGSGGGLPGLVIGAVLADDPAGPVGQDAVPDMAVDLVESNARKCAFLRAVIRDQRLPCHVHQKRIEQIIGTLPAADVVTARALAPLSQLLEWCGPLWPKGTRALFSKGQGAEMELTQARLSWRIDAVLHPSRTDPQARIVEILHAERK